METVCEPTDRPTERQTDNSKEIKNLKDWPTTVHKCISNDKKIPSYVDFIISYVQNWYLICVKIVYKTTNEYTILKSVLQSDK